MSKFLLGTIVAAVLIGLTSVSQAQISPGATPPPKSTVPAPTSPPKASTSTAPDLTLLSKAIGVFWQSDRTETSSQMFLYGKGQGIDRSISAQINTIAQIGNKFQTQLVVAPTGSSPKITYTIVSNGKDVWIYRPDRRQYAKTTFTAFRSSSNWLWTGVSSSLFLSITAADRQEMLSSLGTDRDVIKSVPPEQFKDLIGSERQIDGKTLYGYSYNFKDAGFSVDILLQPQLATVQKIEFSGKVDDMDVKISENIFSRNPQVNITKKTFEFAPPKGVKKVKTLEIELFRN
jgi:outer membrane lipoprotein-sorting protein